MTITIPLGRTLPLQAKAGVGFQSAGLVAAPSGPFSVSSVSGTFQKGQAITVSGSGFGTKASGQGAPQIPVQNWSGASEGQLLDAYDPTWEAYQTQNGGLITLLDGVDGSGCAYNTTNRHDFDTNSRSFTPADRMFCSSFYKVEGLNGENAVIKLKRASSSVSAGGGGVYNGPGRHTLSSWSGSNGAPQIYINAGSGDLGEPFGGLGEYVSVGEDVWRRIDYEIILSTPGEFDGFFAVESMGLEHHEYANIRNREAGLNFQMDTLLLGLMPANNTGTTLTTKEDLVYADTSFCRIEIGNNSDYFACTYRRILDTIEWTDGQVSVTCPYDVPSGNYTVFVIREDRQKTTFEVTV